jgi:hypothetical protein
MNKVINFHYNQLFISVSRLTKHIYHDITYTDILLLYNKSLEYMKIVRQKKNAEMTKNIIAKHNSIDNRYFHVCHIDFTLMH